MTNSGGTPGETKEVSVRNDNRGGLMSGFLVFFVCAVALIVAGLWLLDKADNTAFSKMQTSFNEWKTEFVGDYTKKVEELEGKVKDSGEEIGETKNLVNQVLAEMKTLRDEHKLVLEKVSISDRVARDARKQCDALQDHNARLRESLLQVQNTLAGKRVVHQHLWKGPIPMETHVNPKSTNSGVPGTKERKKRTTKQTK